MSQNTFLSPPVTFTSELSAADRAALERAGVQAGVYRRMLESTAAGRAALKELREQAGAGDPGPSRIDQAQAMLERGEVQTLAQGLMRLRRQGK